MSKANTGANHLPKVIHSSNTTNLILKLNPNMPTSTNSVSTIVEKTESQLHAEAELDWTHELSTDCETVWISSIQTWIMDLIQIVMS